MPRARRNFEPQAIYHLISRFVASEWFIRSTEDRATYLRLLGYGVARSDWRCFSFAIMSNHIHLGVVAGFEPLAGWMRDVHTQFAEWINHRHKRIGAVFVRGPNSFQVRPDGVTRVIGYIHRNPVRAGVVSNPNDSDWTSHAAYSGRAERPPWLDSQCGLDRASRRAERFRAAHRSHEARQELEIKNRSRAILARVKDWAVDAEIADQANGIWS